MNGGSRQSQEHHRGAAGRRRGRSDAGRIVRRRPGRRLARHRRVGDGVRGRVRDRDSGRGRREDHPRQRSRRVHRVARQVQEVGRRGAAGAGPRRPAFWRNVERPTSNDERRT